MPEERGAMRILPGSARQVASHWTRTLRHERLPLLPRVHGVLPSPPAVRTPPFPWYSS